MFGMSAEYGSGTPTVGGPMYRQPAPPRAICDATVSAVGTYYPRASAHDLRVLRL